METIPSPTGMRVERERMERNGIRLDIERLLIKPPLFIGNTRIGDVEVSGAVRTGNGLMSFETLPVRTFSSWKAARAFARKILSTKKGA